MTIANRLRQHQRGRGKFWFPSRFELFVAFRHFSSIFRAHFQAHVPTHLLRILYSRTSKGTEVAHRPRLIHYRNIDRSDGIEIIIVQLIICHSILCHEAITKSYDNSRVQIITSMIFNIMMNLLLLYQTCCCCWLGAAL